jgi:hypothetical protein
MRLRTILTSICVAFASLGAGAQANDSSALLEAGGIVLTTSPNVTMESEDLTIAQSRVRVSYVFRNKGTAEVRTRVAFPVPPFPEVPDYDIQIDRNSRNPMGFKLWVDGKRTAFETEQKTKVGKDGEREKTVTHHWMQVFPPQRAVAIVHEYTPVAGGFFTHPGADFRQEMARTYCVGPKLIAALEASEHWLRNVHYILTTGANWKGPIGRFKLTIVKESPGDKVSVCLPDTRRVSATTFEVTRTNFVPDEDLKILFIPAPGSQ